MWSRTLVSRIPSYDSQYLALEIMVSISRIMIPRDLQHSSMNLALHDSHHRRLE